MSQLRGRNSVYLSKWMWWRRLLLVQNEHQNEEERTLTWWTWWLVPDGLQIWILDTPLICWDFHTSSPIWRVYREYPPEEENIPWVSGSSVKGNAWLRSGVRVVRNMLFLEHLSSDPAETPFYCCLRYNWGKLLETLECWVDIFPILIFTVRIPLITWSDVG